MFLEAKDSFQGESLGSRKYRAKELILSNTNTINNIIIAILLGGTTVLGLIRGLPQIIKTLKLKRSGQISIPGLILSLSECLLYVLYSFYTTDSMYKATCWVSFVLTTVMACVVIKYRSKKD